MRFNTKIPNEGDLYANDRKLMMRCKNCRLRSYSLVHPELYEIKENKAIQMKAGLEMKKKQEILQQIKSGRSNSNGSPSP
jgi:hypothetical protein